jgi:hypothetical protein
MTAQTDAPDHAEIWLEPKAAEYTEEGRMWCQDQVWDESDGTPQRYVRSDLHDAAQAEIAKLREALGDIAKQRTTGEMTQDDCDDADFIGGYDMCIKVARAATEAQP